MLTYISTERAENDAQNTLASFFGSNRVDTSIFPRIIRTCISKMGMVVLPEKEAVVYLDKCKADLPDDFFKIKSAQVCQSHRVVDVDQTYDIVKRDEIVLNACETVLDVCHDECGNAFKITQHIGYGVYEWSDFLTLYPSERCKEHCSSDCLFKKQGTSLEFRIEESCGKKQIVTSFVEGPVVVRYIGTLESESTFFIPDHPIIENYIYKALVAEAMKHMFYQGHDVAQKMAFANQEFSIAQEEARQIWTRSGRKGYYSMGKVLADRYKKQSDFLTPMRQ